MLFVCRRLKVKAGKLTEPITTEKIKTKAIPGCLRQPIENCSNGLGVQTQLAENTDKVSSQLF